MHKKHDEHKPAEPLPSQLEIEELKIGLEDTKNKLLRALADFDNYKKRTTAEREQFLLFANENLILDLLPILDGFGRAIKSAEEHHINEEVIKGLALIKRQYEDTLKKYGLMEIGSLNQPFDPHFHEAVLQKESDQPEGIIIEEMQKGYTLNKKVIRPAMVIVSKGGS